VLTVLSFSLVLVSPLTRARETCRLAGFADRAVVDADLLEWDYGDVEGRTTADVRRERPGWLIWDDDLGEGERLGDVAARADRVIERVLGAPGDVLLFGHGHQLRVLTARWCELSPVEARRFRLDPATTSVLGWEHEYRTVRAWNRRPPDRT
jgi:probable phosphoglycerate mutase